jgi:integrase
MNTTIWDLGIPGFGARRQRRTPTFVMRVNGAQRVLGHFPSMSVDAARKAALEILQRPVRASRPALFHEAVDLYLGGSRWRPSTRREIERYLTEDARPLAQKRLSEIDRAAIVALLNTARGDVARNRLRSWLSAFFNYAITEDLCEHNPVERTRRMPEQSRSRVLSREEIAALWRGLPPTAYGDIVRLLLLTGQRRSEIAGLLRSEIILDADPRIILPAQRTKANREHIVPLAPAAISILKPYMDGGGIGEKVPAVTDASGSTDVSFALFNGWASFSHAKAALDRELGMAHFRLHDIRRSAATWIAELGFGQPHIVEAILNHAKPAIAGIYNRASYQREMRSALTQWAEFVEAL